MASFRSLILRCLSDDAEHPRSRASNSRDRRYCCAGVRVIEKARGRATAAAIVASAFLFNRSVSPCAFPRVANLLSECLLFREQFLRAPAFVERTAGCVRFRIDAGAATLTSESSCVGRRAVRSDVQGKAALRGPGQPPLEKSVPARDMPSEGCLFERRHPNSAGTAASGRKILAKQAKRFGQQTGRDQLIPGRLER